MKLSATSNVELYSLTGAVLNQWNINADPGTSGFDLNCPFMKPGAYYLRISTGDKVFSLPLLVK
ncbi:MAG: T9SS type A sorting domain-containing protein [Bacteroidota bacterium]